MPRGAELPNECVGLAVPLGDGVVVLPDDGPVGYGAQLVVVVFLYGTAVVVHGAKTVTVVVVLVLWPL